MQQAMRFEDLTGKQKAAVLLIALGITESSGVMEQFTQEEIETITVVDILAFWGKGNN